MPMTREQMILMLLMAVLGGTGARFIEFLGKRKSEKLYKNDFFYKILKIEDRIDSLKARIISFSDIF